MVRSHQPIEPEQSTPTSHSKNNKINIYHLIDDKHGRKIDLLVFKTFYPRITCQYVLIGDLLLYTADRPLANS